MLFVVLWFIQSVKNFVEQKEARENRFTCTHTLTHISDDDESNGYDDGESEKENRNENVASVFWNGVFSPVRRRRHRHFSYFCI